MKIKYIFVSVLFLLLFSSAKAQDSAKVAQTLNELLSICKNVDFGDPKTQELGLFYKAAPYIVYRGEDEKRNWKSEANYNNSKEKEQVNEVCLRINGSINQDSVYRIVAYKTETESEGKWYMLLVKYTKKGKERAAMFAFLKIGDKFLLGDID